MTLIKVFKVFTPLAQKFIVLQVYTKKLFYTLTYITLKNPSTDHSNRNLEVTCSSIIGLGVNTHYGTYCPRMPFSYQNYHENCNAQKVILAKDKKIK